MNKVSGIYVIINVRNSKVYIGQTQDFHQRWKEHKRHLNGGYHENHHLQSAWNKYGAKVFKFQILEYCPIDRLDEREQYFLDVHMVMDICYNIAKDVKASMRGRIQSDESRRKIGDANRGHVHSDEVRRKIAKASKGRVHSEEARRKISEAAKVQTRPPVSDETRRKLSESRKGKVPSEETRLKLSDAQKARRTRERTEREECPTD